MTYVYGCCCFCRYTYTVVVFCCWYYVYGVDTELDSRVQGGDEVEGMVAGRLRS